MNVLNRSLSSLACHVCPWCSDKYHCLVAKLCRGAQHREERTKSLWAELAHERQLESDFWLVLAAAGLGAIAVACILG